MNTYTESKKKIDAIRREYSCKGDVIFRTAIQMIVENGQNSFKDENWFDDQMNFIDERHDAAELVGRILFMTRDFEKAIFECAKELSNVECYDLLTYIQREVWLGGGEIGEPDYQRALQIIRNCLYYTDNECGYYSISPSETLSKFREMELTDDEIAYFGWEYLFDTEEEDE